jgi:hypothetical protein
MPSRKVRRRRAKLRRHEYEYVIETPEGEEIPVERPGDRDRQTDGRGRAKGPVDRRGRPVPQPTWRRALRRTAIFAPFIFVFIYLTQGNNLTVAGIVVNTIVLLAFFLPFSYFVDRLVYRMLTRRLERERGRGR